MASAAEIPLCRHLHKNFKILAAPKSDKPSSFFKIRRPCAAALRHCAQNFRFYVAGKDILPCKSLKFYASKKV